MTEFAIRQNFDHYVQKLAKDGTLDDRELAEVIRVSAGEELPQELLDYVADHLIETATRSRGRPKKRQASENFHFRAAVTVAYYKRLDWIKNRLRKKHGEFSLYMLKHHRYANRKPSEIASMMVAKLIGRPNSHNSIRNLIYSRKKPDLK